jgi:hypothetical protein
VSLIDLPNFDLRKTIVYREWNNIDLLVEIGDIVIVIENKFLTNEHGNQLFRYQKTVNEAFPKTKKVFVYLTPYGDEASEKETYINYSYERILEILKDLLNLYNDSLNNATAIYIKDYIHAVKLLVMEDNQINDLVRKIYNNHKDLLDEIFRCKPDSVQSFNDFLKNFLETKGFILGSTSRSYVRFLPKEINDLIPKGLGKGWLYKESFLFEISTLGDKKVALKAVVSPGDVEVRKLLIDILNEVPKSKKPVGGQWLNFVQSNLLVNHKMLAEEGEVKVSEALDREWYKAEELINNVSKAILFKANDFKMLISKRKS